MPRTACDPILKADLQGLINEVGSCAAVAEMLGLERTMVWRFSQTGAAITKNRKALYDALDAYFGDSGKKRKSATEILPSATISQQKTSVEEDFRRMKALLNGLAEIMDFYEKNAFKTQSESVNQVGDKL